MYPYDSQSGPQAGIGNSPLTPVGEVEKRRLKGFGCQPEMDGMGFEEGLRHLKNGLRITRRGWNGKGQFVFEGLPCVHVNTRPRPGAQVTTMDAAEAFRASYAGPVFCLLTTQGMIQVGWLATQSDLMACDWEIVS